MPIIAAPDSTKLLFTIEIGDDETRVMRSRGTRKPNIRLSCGLPVATNLFEEYADWGKKVPLEFRSQWSEFDFWLVQMVFTLEVKGGFSVDWMELGVRLSYPAWVPSKATIISKVKPGTVPGHKAGDQPIAYDLYPLRVVDKVPVEEKLTIAPSLEFMKTKITLGEAGLVLKYTDPLPRVTAFKKREPDPYWRFEPGDAPYVEPGVKELQMIVRNRKSKPLRAAVWVKGKGTGFIFPEKIAEPAQSRFYF